MGISMRQHLASLVAVFLAMLIGVLVGVSLSQEPALQKSMDRLTQVHEEMEQEQQKLAELNDLHAKFESSAAPLLVRGRLADRNVAIFMTCLPEDRDLRDEVIAVLKLAGALDTITVTFWGDYTTACERRGPRLLEELRLSQKNGQTLPALIAGLAAGAVASGNAERLNALGKRRLLNVDGELPGPLRLAVVVGGAASPAEARRETLDEPLIAALLEAEMVVVGCESSEAAESYMRAYQKANIATVDHLDTVPGLLSMVTALSGQPGHYGIKPTAALPFPLLTSGDESFSRNLSR